MNLTEPERTGWERMMGIRFITATTDEVVAEMNVSEEHHQPMGAVHGGVYCGLIESATSRGAYEVTKSRGQAPPVGVENHTSFIRTARCGRIRVSATPITRGRSSQLWEANVRDEAGQLLATGRVRLVTPSNKADSKP